jgi:hypothetical protein
MIKTIISASALLALACPAFAQSTGTGGTADLLVQYDTHGYSETSVTETATGKITGNGEGAPGHNSMVNLQSQAGTVNGQIFGRFLNLTCTAQSCSSQNATEVNIQVTNSNGAVHLDGTFNYNFVHVTLSQNKISVSTNSANFDLTRQSNGTFTGEGADSTQSLDPGFDVIYTATGSFQNLAQNPALALAVLVSPFVH